MSHQAPPDLNIILAELIQRLATIDRTYQDAGILEAGKESYETHLARQALVLAGAADDLVAAVQSLRSQLDDERRVASFFEAAAFQLQEELSALRASHAQGVAPASVAAIANVVNRYDH